MSKKNDKNSTRDGKELGYDLGLNIVMMFCTAGLALWIDSWMDKRESRETARNRLGLMGQEASYNFEIVKKFLGYSPPNPTFQLQWQIPSVTVAKMCVVSDRAFDLFSEAEIGIMDKYIVNVESWATVKKFYAEFALNPNGIPEEEMTNRLATVASSMQLLSVEIMAEINVLNELLRAKGIGPGPTYTNEFQKLQKRLNQFEEDIMRRGTEEYRKNFQPVR